MSRVNKIVTGEMVKWHLVLDELKLSHMASQANFIYFDTKRPYAEINGILKGNNIVIGRAFPPYDTWICISIGLPEENKKIQHVIKGIFKQ